jgi:hypothetical protein
MAPKSQMTLHLLDSAYQMMKRHLQKITLEEALFVPPGGYRSVLGTLKHAAAWSHVYRSYAFDAQPKSWAQIDWPHGQRDMIIKSDQYLQDIIAWFDKAQDKWVEDLSHVTEDQLREQRPLHWGQTETLYGIVVMIAGHHSYHAGELNQLLSIYRSEAWEEAEEVEENNVSTVGHRVRPPWLDN